MRLKSLPIAVLLLVFVIGFSSINWAHEEPATKVTEHQLLALERGSYLTGIEWLNTEEVMVVVSSGEPAGYTEVSLYIFDLEERKGRTIFAADGWRARIRILDVDREGKLIAVESDSSLFILDRDGRELRDMPEVGADTQALFSPDGRYLMYTRPAEWELPTNLWSYDLETGANEQLTEYEFGQQYKVGTMGWGPDGELYYLEQFAFGTVAMGGRRLFCISADEEPSLLWEASSEEQILRFVLLPEDRLLALKVLWDENAINTQLYLAGYDIKAANDLLWAVPLDEMGDLESWYYRHPLSMEGYPRRLDVRAEWVFVTGMLEGDYTMFIIDYEQGEVIKTLPKAGFPRICPEGESIMYLDFSQEEPKIHTESVLSLTDGH